MRNLSSMFKEQLNKDNRNYLEWADITLTDGTKLSLSNEHIWNNGIKVEDAVSSSSEFQIGAAIINKATLTINNIYDDFSDYAFERAEVVLYVGLQLGTERERIRMFTGHVVDAPVTNSSIITLPCYDNMYAFDKDYSESKLTYPASRLQIVRDACSVCGVSLQTTRFPNDDYVIKERPADEQLTFRQVLSWVAQIGGQWCKCDSYGRLCIDWYNLTDYEATTINESAFHIFSSNETTTVNSEDVVITGVRVKEYIENETEDNKALSYLYGKEGYVISVSGNKMIPKDAGEAVSTIIGKRIVGMRFRPFTVSTMNSPAVEAGDICIVVDRKGNRYKSLITSTAFQVGNKQAVTCDAKSAARNSAKQYSIQSQADVAYRKQLRDERTERERALEDLAKRISASSGVYTTEEISSSGGRIFYLHNKPLLKDSDIVWKMTAEAWAVSTDGGKTWNGGMTVDGDTIVRILTATGVNADWIKTGQLSVTDTSGNEVFFVDCDTGIVRIKAQSFSLVTGETMNSIAESEVNKFVENVYNTDKENIQSQIDGKIETWFYDYKPTLSNYPAYNWRTEAVRLQHSGDLFFWKTQGYTYRFDKVDNSWGWQLIQDSDISSAMTAASNAKDTADSKRRVFTTTPYPPYDVGDLWSGGSSGDLKRCKVARATGYYRASDWEIATKYTDDTYAKNVESNVNASITALSDKIELKVTASDVESIIEQKANSIRLKASKISWESTYSSMTENGTLTCQNATIKGIVSSENGTEKVSMRKGKLEIIYNSQNVGLIGGNGFEGYSDKEGLNFDLEYTGDYMAWAAQSSSGANYTVKWTYARASFGNLTGGALNAGCDIDMHGYTLKNPKFEGGGINGTINFVQVKGVDSDGTCNTWTNGCQMQFKNGILIYGSWG